MRKILTITAVLPIIAIFLYGSLFGCVLRFKDVSEEPEYSPLLNTRYALKTEMYIFGVNLPPGYGDDINIYTMHPTDCGRISGPEILSEDTLGVGTILKIKSIIRSVNHLPKCQEIDAIVSVNLFKKRARVPVRISLEYLQSPDCVYKLEKAYGSAGASPSSLVP